MAHMSRRQFFRRSEQGVAGVSAGLLGLNSIGSATEFSANNRIVLAQVGCGGRGSQLAMDFAKRADCTFAYVCDADSGRMASLAKGLSAIQEKPPQMAQDFRRALADRSVDAVVIATPDHWHALATIWACQAGKDVYVEKPPSHSCWEGRKMVEAARKHNRIVQVGLQNRSAEYNRAARQYLRDGKLGRIHLCRVFNMKEWGNAPLSKDGDPPKGLDWDMWNGPAPLGPYNNTRHHYWNHLWCYSGGDIINDGIHQLDLARWVIGVDSPSSVYGTGGRYDSTGAAETPDTQIVTYQFEQLVMTFELTLYTPYMHKIAPVIRQSKKMFPFWPQCATRIEIYGSAGVMYLGRHGGGWQVFGAPKLQEGVCVAQNKGLFPDPEHKENFIQAIRTRRLPSADVEEGHRSTLLAHYGNISNRLGGQKLLIDSGTERIVGNDQAMALFKRTYRKPWVIEEEV
jgi:predicted dehydrogenase